jgi:type I restriction enzyme S subunit
MTNTKLKVGNVPNLRFPGFVGEWEEKRLKDLGSFFSGGTPKTTNKDYYDGNIPFIRSGEIHFDTTELHISQDGLKNSSAKMINRGQILIALYGATSGEISISKIHGAINQAILCFDTKINRQFFKNLWQKHVDKILKSYLQGGQGNLSAEIIKQLAFDFPVKDEQTKIADFINKIEKYIETQSKIIEELETLIKGISEKLFTQKIRFKEFTDEWEVSKLGEIFYSEKGKGLSKDKLVIDGKYDCVLYGELYTKYKEVIFSIVSKTNEDSGLKSQIGDLLIPSSTTTSGIDLANVTAINKENVLLGGDITVLRSKEKINNIFYAYYLSNYKKEEIASYAQGSTIVHLYYSHIKDMLIDFPSFEEQTIIAEFLSDIDEKIQLERDLLDKYQSQKKYLLQSLFI